MHYQAPIDNNKLESLQIAYQFTSEVLPSYKQDGKAFDIHQIIRVQDESCNNITFLELDDNLEIINEHASLFDFGNSDKRYILVTNNQTKGLLCTISLASTTTTIVMSNKVDYLNTNDFIIGINHISEQTFEIYNTITALDKLYKMGYMQLYFIYGWNSESNKSQQLKVVCNHDSQIPLYNKRGEQRYYNITHKLFQQGVPKEAIDKVKLNIMGVKYFMNEVLFVHYANIPFQLVEVDLYWIRTDKL